MEILVLEDRQDVIDLFVQNISKDHEVHYVKTSTDAIWNISQNSYDVIFLDHDVPSTHEHNGLEVAIFLATRFLMIERLNPQLCPSIKNLMPKVVIHSRNKFGSACMKQILPNALCWPGIQEFPEQLSDIIWH